VLAFVIRQFTSPHIHHDYGSIIEHYVTSAYDYDNVLRIFQSIGTHIQTKPPVAALAAITNGAGKYQQSFNK
jgi:hypothetical protein